MMFGIPAQFCSLFVRYSCLYFCWIRAYCQLLVLKNEKLKKEEKRGSEDVSKAGLTQYSITHREL